MRKIVHTVESIDPRVIIVLFAIYVLDRLLMAYKWGLLVKSFNYKVGFWKLAKAYFYGSFITQFMPISISGDIVRFYSVMGDDMSKTNLFSSMVVEKVFGFFAMIAAVVIAIALYGSPFLVDKRFFNIIVVLLVLVVLTIIALFVIFRTSVVPAFLEKYKGRFSAKIEKIVSSFSSFSRKKEILRTFLFLSLIEQIFPAVSVFILARSMGIEVSFLQILFIATLGFLVARLPISPSAIGVQEGVFVGLFVLVGLRAEAGFALSITIRVLDMIYPLPIILIFFSETMQLVKRAKGQQAPSG